jgi:hypothetical protein
LALIFEKTGIICTLIYILDKVALGQNDDQAAEQLQKERANTLKPLTNET